MTEIRKKILVVDDEEYLIKLLKSRLLVHRFEVVTAYNGREALEKAKSEKPDLIILDVLLPVMNGAEFVKEIKKVPAIRDTPVIVISAQPETKEEFEPKDIVAFVNKPFQPDEFISQVKKAIP
ncbi:MAG TPA: response regulator [Verrucomicrobiae bacterium]|jgi:CheY-like chemotaxis protein|nr:response regulator [Verrucomicrobiae bacterium]